MNAQIDLLVEQARHLSLEEQAVLAEKLYEMIHPTDQEWESAWVAECNKRLDAYRNGETSAIDSEEAMALLCGKHGLK